MNFRSAARLGGVGFTESFRREATMSNERLDGHVTFFSRERGFGFVRDSSGRDYFVHHSAIRALGYRLLREGAPVEFSPGVSPKGPVALDVVEV